jgi:hypothetical protein
MHTTFWVSLLLTGTDHFNLVLDRSALNKQSHSSDHIVFPLLHGYFYNKPLLKRPGPGPMNKRQHTFRTRANNIRFAKKETLCWPLLYCWFSDHTCFSYGDINWRNKSPQCIFAFCKSSIKRSDLNRYTSKRMLLVPVRTVNQGVFCNRLYLFQKSTN